MTIRNSLKTAVGISFLTVSASALCQPAPAAPPAPAATTTTTTTVRSGVVVFVSGNTLITKESDGVTRQHNVPDGYFFQMNGKNVTLADLKPGDKITATITETRTVEPVTVTQVLKGTVVESSMGSILVKNQKGKLIKYSSKDEQGRDVTIYQNGQQVKLSDLKAGDQLTATIVSRYPPQVSTMREVTSKVTPAPPAPAPAQVAAAEPPPAPAPKPAKLPKTASPLPLVGLLGGLLIGAGAGLRLLRRRSVAS
jgi:hypothetical protein